jgi:hypothetical protein
LDINKKFTQEMYTIDISNSPLYTKLQIGNSYGYSSSIINLIDLSSSVPNQYQIDFSFGYSALYDMSCDTLITIYPLPNTEYGNQNAPPFIIPPVYTNNNNNKEYFNVIQIQNDIKLAFTTYVDPLLNDTPFSNTKVYIDPDVKVGSLGNYYNGYIIFSINVILTEILSNNVKRIRKYDIDNLYATEPLMCFFHYITHLLYVKLLPGSYVKDLYKLSNAEMTQLEGFDSMYSEEIVKRYIYKKYGQEKIDKKREMMDKKSENMRKLRKEESERKDRLMQERKSIVLNILAEHGLHYIWAMAEADRFISEGGTLNEELILMVLNNIVLA